MFDSWPFWAFVVFELPSQMTLFLPVAFSKLSSFKLQNSNKCSYYYVALIKNSRIYQYFNCCTQYVPDSLQSILRVFAQEATSFTLVKAGPGMAFGTSCDVTKPALSPASHNQIFSEQRETFLLQQVNKKTAFLCRTLHIHHSAQWSSHVKV